MSSEQLTLEETRQEKRESGLFLCDACCPLNGRYCRGVFLQEWRCTSHSEKNKHKFPTGVRARDWILKKASDPGGLVATGARVDRSIRTVTGTIVASTNIIPEMMARCKGQFNRKEAATPYKKPKKLLDILEDLYCQEPKLNAKAMRGVMSKMQDNDGGLLFSWKKRFINGLILTESQITSWINMRTQKKKKKGAEKGPSELELDQQELIDQLRRNTA